VNKTQAKTDAAASKQITEMIAQLGDWRGPMVGRLRKVVLAAAPGITEEWKWGTPVWAQNGLVCAAGAFKDHVKLNFFKGALLTDPKRLFNSGLEAKAMRSIDFFEGDKLDEAGLKTLIRAAVALNAGGAKKK
jgi:hypothetical protein